MDLGPQDDDADEEIEEVSFILLTVFQTYPNVDEKNTPTAAMIGIYSSVACFC